MAKRSQFYSVASDAEGNSLLGVTVTVYPIGSVTEANIYSARTGGSPAPNSFETGADGVASFWTEPGSYEVHFHDATIPSRFDDYVVYFESLSGDSAGLDGAQIEDSGIGTTQLADSSVTSAKIANGTIVGGDIASRTINPLSLDVTLEENELDSSDQSITTGGVWINGTQVTAEALNLWFLRLRVGVDFDTTGAGYVDVFLQTYPDAVKLGKARVRRQSGGGSVEITEIYNPGFTTTEVRGWAVKSDAGFNATIRTSPDKETTCFSYKIG